MEPNKKVFYLLVLVIVLIIGFASTVGKYEKQLTDMGKDLERMQQEVKELNNEVTELTDEIVVNRSIMDKQRAEIEAKKKDINKLNKKVEDKDKEIKTLNSKLKKEVTEEVKKNASVNVSRGTNGKQRSMTMEATHYTAFCPTGCTGVTASGYSVKDTIYYNGMRIVATDPKAIPLYSILRVNTGSETFQAIALDTGGDIKGNKRIDILVKTRDEAYKLGRKMVGVTVIREGKGD